MRPGRWFVRAYKVTPDDEDPSEIEKTIEVASKRAGLALASKLRREGAFDRVHAFERTNIRRPEEWPDEIFYVPPRLYDFEAVRVPEDEARERKEVRRGVSRSTCSFAVVWCVCFALVESTSPSRARVDRTDESSVIAPAHPRPASAGTPSGGEHDGKLAGIRDAYSACQKRRTSSVAPHRNRGESELSYAQDFSRNDAG